MGLMSRFNQIIETAEHEIVQLEHKVFTVEHEVVTDAKAIFKKAHEDAIAANLEVARLKGLLQEALVKSRDLHQAAIDAAEEASKVAEEEFNKFKKSIAAHTADYKTQNSQITDQTVAQPVQPPVQPVINNDTPEQSS